MLRTTLAGLRLHKGRLVTTALAIALGVMFVTGTLVFSDTLRASFADQVMGSAEKMDVVVLPEDERRGTVPRDVLAEVRDLPEIDRAAGVTAGDAPLLDKDGRAVGSVPTLGVSVGDLSRYSAAEGELPDAPGEAALATVSASATGYKVGDTATVLGPDGGKHEFTVTGLIDFGTAADVSFRGAVAFTPQTAVEMTGAEGFAEIDAVAAEGVPRQQAVDAVAAVAGSGTEVLTGRELGERLADQAGAQADVLAAGLLLFALVSVLVAAIVIHNTFAILVAQRQREMALLRCVGAVRRQVFTSVVAEALVVGLAASALGVLAGIGLGAAGFALGADALNTGASGAAVVLQPGAVLIGLAAGTATTLFSALLPARRAMSVPPLAALRTSAVAAGLDRRPGLLRAAAASVLLPASAAVVFLSRDAGSPQAGLYLVAGAGMVAFVGVVVAGPLLVRAAVAAVSPLMRALGVSSALAADNARRSPRRAATATIALTVGATLITGYAVINSSMMSTMNDLLDEQFPADYQITGQFTDENPAIPRQVARDLRAAPETAQVVAQRSATDGTPGPDATWYSTLDGAPLEEAASAVRQERAGDLADVRPGSVAVQADYANAEGLGVGDPVTVKTPDGERGLEVAAVVEAAAVWSVLMAPEDFAAAFPGKGDEIISVVGAEGAEAAKLRDAVYAAVEDHPTLQVDSVAQMRKQFEDVLGTAFLAVVAMLGLAVVIAVFGIANTLALSVLERTRESALLRAMGLKRAQLRLMLVWEAVLLCLIGALVGIGLGVSFGWAAADAAFEDLIFSVPIAQIAGFVGAAVAAGLLASVLPSRRAARTSITAALASE
ncbi:FtsX-like permease family protein [Streptomonospora sp. PA3]|uniref:ABC transporter permease n=1 Tax=Streptomonospora sp. PA3 TaxID=2607326 RepID=UPI0012DD111A|nr:FtsX-like permease family protein [Streptomonospora sp. PA3]MUL43417.1 FtsX-like permease family protein [Streptomonospora sp. PA3]